MIWLHNFIWWFDNTADPFTQSVIGNITADAVLFGIPALLVLLRTIRQGRILSGFGKDMKSSPDGSKSVSVVDGEIYVADKGGIHNVTHTKSEEQNASWSGNSKWIAFQREGKLSWEVWVLAPDTLRNIQLATVYGQKRREVEWQGNDLVIQEGGSERRVYEAEIEKRLK